LLMAAFINVPWLTLTVVGLTYLASIPFVALRYRHLQKDYQDHDDIGDLQV